MSEDKHWIEKKHWMVAVWPADETGGFSEHDTWRTSILHADNEEDLVQQLAMYMVPSAALFRIWIMELTPETARAGVMEIKTSFVDPLIPDDSLS